MAKGKSTAKKVVSVIVNVIIWLFVIFAAVVTILTFVSTTKADGTRDIGGRMIFTVQSDSMSPTFNKGDLLVGKRLTDDAKSKLKKDDIISYHYDVNLDGEKNEINSHRIVEVLAPNSENNDSDFVMYKTHGDNNPTDTEKDYETVRADEIICTYSFRVPYAGKVLDFLQTKRGFMLAVVLPMGLFFLYELIIFVKRFTEIKNEGKQEFTAEDEERIRQQAVAEYLKAQSAAAPAGETAKPAEEAAPVTEEAPADEAEEAQAPVEEAAEEATEEPAQEQVEEAAPAEEPAADEPESAEETAEEPVAEVEETEAPAEEKTEK
ncbi:MAG: signal peptidase I [Clostridia bacterium]|nr:signal peptidase I [Clostridia bacterium]